MQYRRTFTPGGAYFFTLVTYQRRRLFVDEKTVEVLREAFRQVLAKRPFTIDAIVLLPDHLHCIWTLPSDDADYPTRWRLIKTWFCKHCDVSLQAPTTHVRAKKGQQTIWQHRYWEHLIRDEMDYRHHVDYIHYNPVKHGYVQRPMDWVYSSFRRYVEEDILSEDWGEGDVVLPEGIGNE